MNVFKKIWQRAFMFVFYKATYVMNWRAPELLEGSGSIVKLPEKIKELGLDNIFFVVDKGILDLGLANPLKQAFTDAGLTYTQFDKVQPDPKSNDIEEGVKLYNESGSKCIVVIGGGSAMDTAKAVAARVTRPKKSIKQLGGLLKVGRKIPPLFAIPTTAGTGSEATIAAVVTNSDDHHKYAINDLHLVPLYAVLDPEITRGLPPYVTATTGMDALTHAVEGYICCDVPKKYKKLAEEAIVTIFKDVEEVYKNGANIEARDEMLKASFKAGQVFTRVGLTYVHPIAHTLGGLYHVPHGHANAVILPYCLEYYIEKGSKSTVRKLAHLAEITGLAKEEMDEKAKAQAFIDNIWRLDKDMNLMKKFDMIQDEDIPQMIKWASHEANAAYFPPVLLGEEDLRILIDRIRK